MGADWGLISPQIGTDGAQMGRDGIYVRARKPGLCPFWAREKGWGWGLLRLAGALSVAFAVDEELDGLGAGTPEIRKATRSAPAVSRTTVP